MNIYQMDFCDGSRSLMLPGVIPPIQLRVVPETLSIPGAVAVLPETLSAIREAGVQAGLENPGPWSDPAQIGVTVRPDPARTGFENLTDAQMNSSSQKANMQTHTCPQREQKSRSIYAILEAQASRPFETGITGC